MTINKLIQSIAWLQAGGDEQDLLAQMRRHRIAQASLCDLITTDYEAASTARLRALHELLMFAKERLEDELDNRC